MAASAAPASYTDPANNPDLVHCPVCDLPYDPTPKGFHTMGCEGCDPDVGAQHFADSVVMASRLA